MNSLQFSLEVGVLSFYNIETSLGESGGKKSEGVGKKGKEEGGGTKWEREELILTTKNNFKGRVINTCKSTQEQAARVRACNYIKFKTRRNLSQDTLWTAVHSHCCDREFYFSTVQ